ncbi:MAG: [acyl-carrier-protein] S-malonyltransferase [Candidatus Schekmanbacteria bacterium]|nr:MAG: [acyl-carrier-protein] S-malonyltransferase [Candidatus Schekmanbacteria bacterium]
MSAKIAFVFPGQASQYVGMGRELYENYESAKNVFEEADKALGISITSLCFEGPEERLKQTEITQPAILTVSIAAHRVVSEKGLNPLFAAGHSLGEYSALVAAGVIDFSEAVKLVKIRGRLMQEAVPEGKGAMAAILGMQKEDIEDCINSLTGLIVSVANYNSPKQTVISGKKEDVEKAVTLLKERGARKVVMLPVSAPFHCELMKPAEEKLIPLLDEIKFAPSKFPVFANVDATETNGGDEAREKLKLQVSRSVLWQQSVENMRKKGVDTFIEIGPGKVLSGLIKQTIPNVEIFNIEDKKTLEKTFSSL